MYSQTQSALHLIADNLGWFTDDKRINIEQIMKKAGKSFKKLETHQYKLVSKPKKPKKE